MGSIVLCESTVLAAVKKLLRILYFADTLHVLFFDTLKNSLFSNLINNLMNSHDVFYEA